MEERGTGVFGSVGGTSQDNEKVVHITIETVAPDQEDSIYNCIFSEYDEEKN